MGTTFGNSVMAFAAVTSAICRDAREILICRFLAQQFGRHGRVTDGAAGDLDRPDLQCFLDAEMNLAPDPPLGAAMLARVLLAFSLDLDPGAVAQEAPVRDVHGQPSAGLSGATDTTVLPRSGGGSEC
jgi:hypothetical protein